MLSSTLIIAIFARHARAGRADELAPLEASYQDRGQVASKTISVSVQDVPIHYLEAGPEQARKLVVFLHGAAFSARTWQVVGVLDRLAEAGILAIAIDAPGYGEQTSGSAKLSAAALRAFLASFLQAIGWKRKVVVVSASFGGIIGSPFVFDRAGMVAGYVSVAAAINVAPAQHAASKVPTLLIWGELDHPDSNGARQSEAVFARHTKVVFPDAPHPAYLHDPKLFISLVLQFVGAAPSPTAVVESAPPLIYLAEW